MKTKKNWFVIVAAMIMSSVMILASCSSDDDPMLLEVIESEVLDEGMDDTASSKPSINPNGVTTGTQFSYKSWIMVKGQTRAAFENKVEVTLNNVFANTDTVITVSNFDLGDYKTVVSKRKRSERQEGFVTVSDSVMVYSVQFAEFSFDYELDFEHAVYNDGVTKQNMPYHPIGTIKDNGYKLEELDSSDDGEYAYAQKKLVHSISVQFNGKTYELKANVLLRRKIGSANQPYILRSTLVSKQYNVKDGLFECTLKVRQVWSDGNVKEENNSFNLEGYIHSQLSGYVKLRNFNNDLSILKSTLHDNKTYWIGVAHSRYVSVLRKEQKWTIEYNYFSIDVEIVSDVAFYDDGVLYCNINDLEISEITNEEPKVVFDSNGEDEGGAYSVYKLTQDIKARFGEMVISGWVEKEIVAYK